MAGVGVVSEVVREGGMETSKHRAVTTRLPVVTGDRSGTQPLPQEQRAQVTYDAYILGPGDGLQIELINLPELSGTFLVGPAYVLSTWKG